LTESIRQIRIAREQARKTLYEFLTASASLRYSRPTARIRRFRTAEDQILSAVAKKINPPPAACECLKAELNRGVHRVSYDQSRLIIQKDPMREAAERLCQYVELTHICGPMHTACKLEGCHEIVFGGRGNKRYCCPQHREAYWTYDRIKQMSKYGADYFKDRQRKTRATKKEQKKAKLRQGKT